MKRPQAIEIIKLLIGLLLFLAAFEALAAATNLPHVPAVLSSFVRNWISGPFPHDVAVSTARWLIGWAVGSVIGIALGLSTGRVRALSISMEGFLVLCRAVPFIGLLPLTIRLVGLSEIGKFNLVAWSSATTCWIIVHQAARLVPESVRWRCVSLGVNGPRRLFLVVIPLCSAGIFSALRTSLGLGLIVISVAELGGVYARSSGLWFSEGLGYRLFRSLEEARDDLLLATILLFSLLGIVVDRAFVLTSWSLDRAARAWKRQRVERLVRAAKRSAENARDWQGRAFWPPPMELKVHDLSASYDGVVVLDRLSLSVPAGKTLAIVAPSGAGKTTMIRAIGRFEDNSFRAHESITLGTSRPDRAGSWVGLVLQEASVFNHLTVWDNLAIGSRMHDLDAGVRGAVAWFFLCEFGLSDLASRRADQLSVGQRHRLALAAVLANQPQCILLDEPLANLDFVRRRQLQSFYLDHVAGKVTAIFVSHDITEAIAVGDYVQVGLATDAPTFPVPRNGLSLSDWEESPAFAELRRTIVALLTTTHGAGS